MRSPSILDVVCVFFLLPGFIAGSRPYWFTFLVVFLWYFGYALIEDKMTTTQRGPVNSTVTKLENTLVLEIFQNIHIDFFL